MFENLMKGLSVSAIGMIVVFIGLLILIGLIKIMTTINDRRDAQKKAKAQEATSAAKPAQEAPKAEAQTPSTVQTTPAEEIALNDDSEIVAAIMAAISLVYEGTGKRAVVRSVRRSSRNWANSYK